MMRRMMLTRPGPVATRPLRMEKTDIPVPGHGEVLVRVEACGVCRTDLHVVEGDLEPRRDTIVPGHEVVGRVGPQHLDPRCRGAGRASPSIAAETMKQRTGQGVRRGDRQRRGPFARHRSQGGGRGTRCRLSPEVDLEEPCVT